MFAPSNWSVTPFTLMITVAPEGTEICIELVAARFAPDTLK